MVHGQLQSRTNSTISSGLGARRHNTGKKSTRHRTFAGRAPRQDARRRARLHFSSHLWSSTSLIGGVATWPCTRGVYRAPARHRSATSDETPPLEALCVRLARTLSRGGPCWPHVGCCLIDQPALQGDSCFRRLLQARSQCRGQAQLPWVCVPRHWWRLPHHKWVFRIG